MKYFIAIALIAAVASAAVRPTVRSEAAEIQEIIAAIQSPSTDPATAAALEQMLLDVLGAEPVAVGPAIINPVEGIAVGPAIVNPVEGISVGPAIIPFPLPDGGAVAEEPIIPSPVIVAPTPAVVIPSANTPLVQIILKINQAAAESGSVSVGPAVTPEHVEIQPSPVHIVEVTPEPVNVVEVASEPVQVVEVAPEPVQVVEVAPEPIQVVEVAPEPIQVVEVAPIPAEPVQIGVPVIVNPVEGIAVGPAIVNPVEGISVGPAIIPFPLPDGGAVAEEPIVPSPVIVAPTPAVVAPSANTPLVQIILNTNQAAAESGSVSVGPAVTPEHVEIQPSPVHIVEVAPEPVSVVEVAPEPVQVVEVAPIPAEPVQIGVPVIPEAAVILPEELN